MRPVHHVVAAGAGVPIYFMTGSVTFAAIFCIAEIFMDVDHVIDYIFFGKRPLSVAMFFKEGNPLEWSCLVFFMHSYEWMVLLAVFSGLLKNSMLAAVTAGLLFHLILDEFGNRIFLRSTRLNRFFYFFTFRLLSGFDIKKMAVTI